MIDRTSNSLTQQLSQAEASAAANQSAQAVGARYQTVLNNIALRAAEGFEGSSKQKGSGHNRWVALNRRRHGRFA